MGKTARWVALVLTALAAAALAGTATGTRGSSGRTQATTISYLTHWGPDQVAMLKRGRDGVPQARTRTSR